MNVFVLIIYLAQIYFLIHLHHQWYGVSFEPNCYPRVSTARNVTQASLELYKLVAFMAENKVSSSADCNANVRVVWLENDLMINPYYQKTNEERYECSLFNKQTIKHGRELYVTYLDLWMQPQQKQLYGRVAVCQFLHEYHKFHTS